MDCVGEAGPAPRETARGGTKRARKSQADARLLAIFYLRDVMARRYKCGGALPRMSRPLRAMAAKCDRHAADLAQIISWLDPDGSLSPSRPYPFSIESLTLRPRRSKCTPHRGHAAIRQ